MTDTKTQADAGCDTELHGEHLCYIISQGLDLTDALEYEALVREPRFRCGHCRRMARNGENLCVPIDI
jgi:hypothetical protein